MTKAKLSNRIDHLFKGCEWEKARRLLATERNKEPENHWLLTQLGVTFYEQRRYEEALTLFVESRQIVADCPLTLWNLAGTLDAIADYPKAIQIYTWLVENESSPDQDPCWESKSWADELKTDCVYRLGSCYQQLGKTGPAERCYHQYLNLLSMGIQGLYSVEDVMRELGELHGNGKNGAAEHELRKVAEVALQASGLKPRKGRRNALPEFDMADMLSGSGVASKG